MQVGGKANLKHIHENGVAKTNKKHKSKKTLFYVSLLRNGLNILQLELFKWQLTTYGTLSCCTLNHFWWNILIIFN